MTQHQTVTLDTPRFGEIEFDPVDVLEFPEGLVGLPAMRQFLVIPHRSAGPFFWLQSVEEPGFAVLTVDPEIYQPGYSTQILKVLGREPVDGPTELVYTVCTIPPGDPNGMTLNLAGPIVINTATGKARQIVLESDAYPVRYPAFRRLKEAA
ncbi:MAG: flagellar assembly protein FliW [Fimbriimonadaceae bacterium]|nr:flagellar assembly protein FliW [Fimbriimonadaceae bacterium]QYK55890.1 MAG: flagellar assembly protein FliW [Fimbriimonadaceae bacterium]